jgi:Na+-translocating ferredoxin:NAD+ oxidoreductase RNF subunit RnfB
MNEKKYYFPRPVTTYIKFDPTFCNGCFALREPLCVRACRMGIIIPNPSRGKPPIIVYPDECCECGCCVHACPNSLKGAIQFEWPLSELVRWKRKETGGHFRVGMPNPPPPNPRPPVSGWYPHALKRPNGFSSAGK